MTAGDHSTADVQRRWLEMLLRDRLSPNAHLHHGEHAWVIALEGAEGAVRVSRSATDLRVPDPACGMWDPNAEGFASPLKSPLPAPGWAAAEGALVAESTDGWEIGYDVLGLAFWMLTRQEELGHVELDERQRFPASASHAFRHAYLDRPVVDEWIAVLGQLMLRQWPGLALTRHQFEMKVSHDVDNPSRYAFGGLAQIGKMAAFDVLLRRDLRSPARGLLLRTKSRERLHPDDPANTFDWIMDQSDQRGLTSAFHFVCGRTSPALDAHYEPEDEPIRALLRSIHTRGHEIGIHPSYNTFNDPPALAREFTRLRAVCADEGIEQPHWGGRMHFLRWDTAVTLRACNDAGMDYDNTLTYADVPGFRCGTCFEYPAFDPVNNEILHLRIRPLVAMESTVIARRYLGLGEGAEAVAEFAALKAACRAVQGTFDLLWHNSFLESPQRRNLYCKVLDA